MKNRLLYVTEHLPHSMRQVFSSWHLLSANRWRGVVKFLLIWVAAYAVLSGFFASTVLENDAYLEIFPHELVFPGLMYAVNALLAVLAIYWLPWLRVFYSKLVAAVVLVLLIVGYDSNLQAVAGVIRALVPGMTDKNSLAAVSAIYLLILLVLALLAGLAAQGLCRRYPRVTPRDMANGVAVLVAFIFLVPVSSLATKLPTMVAESKGRMELPAHPSAAARAGKPDIYYIVLDRYANQEVLSQQFSFDNGPFVDYLSGHGFRVNGGAYSNYPYTTMSVSSTVNGDYTKRLVTPFKNKDIQSKTLFHNAIWQSSVVRAFKNSGYSYHLIGAPYAATYQSPLADQQYAQLHELTLFGHTKGLRGIEAIEFQKSVFYRFSQLPGVTWWPMVSHDLDPVGGIKEQLDSLQQLSNGPPGGRFILAHILVPHDPFYFNADGSLAVNVGSDNVGQPIKQKYLGQVQFINSQMRQLVDSIDAHSHGQAVIVLNADEGPYPSEMNAAFVRQSAAAQGFQDVVSPGFDDMRGWPTDWLRMKYGILQAVRIPQASNDDLANLSSVNAFRIILNRYLGYDLPYLPDCHYGLTEGVGKSYRYADITAKLTGTANDACKDYQSLTAR